MGKSTLEMLKEKFGDLDESQHSGLEQKYVVSGDMPKALGPSLAEQIRDSNNSLRKKFTY